MPQEGLVGWRELPHGPLMTPRECRQGLLPTASTTSQLHFTGCLPFWAFQCLLPLLIHRAQLCFSTIPTCYGHLTSPILRQPINGGLKQLAELSRVCHMQEEPRVPWHWPQFQGPKRCRRKRRNY